MPGIAQKGDLIIAISTSGRSPAMARKMREEIEEFLTDEWRSDAGRWPPKCAPNCGSRA